MSYLDDPRVLFAAERTLLSWTRASVALIALGFVIERFGLFIKILHLSGITGQRQLSFFIGLALIAFAATMSLFSIIQFKRFLKNLSESEIPKGYMLWCGTSINMGVSILGILLIIYLIRDFG